MSSWNYEHCAIYPESCITARPPYVCPLKHHSLSLLSSPTHVHTCLRYRHVHYTSTHTRKKNIKNYTHTDNLTKLPSHSIWFVISFSALIISQYLGHSPLIISRVLCLVLLPPTRRLGTQTSIRSTRRKEENK